MRLCAWIALAVAAACSADVERSGAAGSSADGGAGGARANFPRRCGMGTACGKGATCEYQINETGVRCDCDPSGHYLCEPWASAGAPPWDPCTPDKACKAGRSCAESNGWCERSCACGQACNMDCKGSGPAQGDPGVLCEAGYCGLPALVFGSCKIDDGDCSYTVSCGPPTLTGNCN